MASMTPANLLRNIASANAVDRGGSDAEMAELNRALSEAKAHYGKA